MRFRRFVDALTPTVANLHPLTVINHLHTSCVSQVESANILKTTENVAKLCQTGTGDANDGIYEETVKTQLQAAIFLPKVIFFDRLLVAKAVTRWRDKMLRKLKYFLI
jgi:hypothetical protein